MLAVAVAGPAASLPVPRAAGTVILAMDVSNSMGATDVAPTRLAAAQKGGRVVRRGQPAASTSASSPSRTARSPPTSPARDHAEAQAAIERLRISGGTSLGAAILTSLSAITGKRSRSEGRHGAGIGYWGSATIVLFSDGEDQGTGQRHDRGHRRAEKAGVHIETVGVGTAAGDHGRRRRLPAAHRAGRRRADCRSPDHPRHLPPGPDASELDGIASTINLRLTVTSQHCRSPAPSLRSPCVLAAAGTVLTVLRTGRVV